MTAIEANPTNVLFETGLLELEAVLQRLHDLAHTGAEQGLAIRPEPTDRDSQPDP